MSEAELIFTALAELSTCQIDETIERGDKMSISNTSKRTVSPAHPGEMLREDFMPDYGLTVTALAAALGVSWQTANELLQCRRAVSPVMTLRLSRLFGNSSAFWLNAQNAFDLWPAERRDRNVLDNVQMLKAA